MSICTRWNSRETRVGSRRTLSRRRPGFKVWRPQRAPLERIPTQYSRWRPQRDAAGLYFEGPLAAKPAHESRRQTLPYNAAIIV
jgi:hypothetical protein